MPTFSGGGNGSFYDVDHDVKIVYLNDLLSNSKNYLNRVKVLRDFIVEKDIDYIVSFITNVNVMALLSTLNLKRPVVVFERSDPYVIPLPFYWKVLRVITYPLADKVLVQTRELLSKLKKDNYCTYKNKLGFISNPISPEFTLDAPCTVQRKKKIIAVGRLSQEKQFHHLIEAFHLAQPKGWVLEIYGEGKERSRLEALIKQYDLMHCIFLCGAVTNLREIYCSSSIFCMTSLYEGFPNALLEAMSSGCATISYKTPSGPAEMLENGRCGLLVELNNVSSLAKGISYLVSNKAKRETFGEMAMYKVRSKYTPDLILSQWDNVFSEMNARNI